MTAAQVHYIRTALGLTQYELGRLLYLEGKNIARTVRNWETTGPTGPVAKALEMIANENQIRL